MTFFSGILGVMPLCDGVLVGELLGTLLKGMLFQHFIFLTCVCCTCTCMTKYPVSFALLPLCETYGDPVSLPELLFHSSQLGQFSSLLSTWDHSPPVLQWSDLCRHTPLHSSSFGRSVYCYFSASCWHTPLVSTPCSLSTLYQWEYVMWSHLKKKKRRQMYL